MMIKLRYAGSLSNEPPDDCQLAYQLPPGFIRGVNSCIPHRHSHALFPFISICLFHFVVSLTVTNFATGTGIIFSLEQPNACQYRYGYSFVERKITEHPSKSLEELRSYRVRFLELNKNQ